MSTMATTNGDYHRKQFSISKSPLDKHGLLRFISSAPAADFDFNTATIDLVEKANQPMYLENVEVVLESFDSCSIQQRGLSSESSTVFDEASSGIDGYPLSSPWELLERQIRSISDINQAEYQQKKLMTRQSSEVFQTVMNEFQIEEERNQDELNKTGVENLRKSESESSDGLRSAGRLIVDVGSVGEADRAKLAADGRFAWPRSREDALSRDSRRFLYNRYIDSSHSWADGLTKNGKEILSEVRTRKKGLHRVRTAPSFGTPSTAGLWTKTRPDAAKSNGSLRSASTSNFRRSSSTSSTETNSN